MLNSRNYIDDGALSYSRQRLKVKAIKNVMTNDPLTFWTFSNER